MIVLWPDSYCHDVGGYVDPDNYETRDGLYPKAYKAMICRLTSTEDDNDCPNMAFTAYSISFAALVALTVLSFAAIGFVNRFFSNLVAPN